MLKDIIQSKIVSLVTSIIVIAIIGFIVIKNPFNWQLFNFAFNNQLKIDKTENVVDQIKKISEFTSACYYQELVVKKDKVVKKEETTLNTLAKTFHLDDGKDSIQNQVVLIVKGKVRAGFNLQKIKDEDIQVKSDTLSIVLPKAEIFDVIINPSDYEVYIEEGKWSHEEITAIQSKTKETVKANALNNRILEKADNFGKEKLESLFKTFGFEVVNINLN